MLLAWVLRYYQAYDHNLYLSGMGQRPIQSSYNVFSLSLLMLWLLMLYLFSTLYIIFSIMRWLLRIQRNSCIFHILPCNSNDATISFWLSHSSTTLSEIQLFSILCSLVTDPLNLPFPWLCARILHCLLVLCRSFLLLCFFLHISLCSQLSYLVTP